MIAVGHRVSYRSRTLIKEALNVDTYSGIVKFVKAILLTTLFFESLGAILSFIVFSQDYPTLHALGISVFHSIAAFNNSGFDILGGLRNLIPYQENVLLNLTTCGLIFFGGIGFLVIMDILKQRKFKKLMFHSKVVLTTSIVLIIVDSPAKADRAHYMAWRVVSQCFGENSRFFNISDRKLQHSRTLCPLCSDVYRCFSGINRRRYQDEYILYPCTGSPEYVFKTCGWRI